MRNLAGGRKADSPPTRVITRKDGTVVGDPKQIQAEFTQEWKKKVFCKERTKPKWDEFVEQHGQFVPQAVYTKTAVQKAKTCTEQ